MKLSTLLVLMFLGSEVFAQTPYAKETPHEFGIDVRSFFDWGTVEIVHRARIPGSKYIRTTLGFTGFTKTTDSDLPDQDELPESFKKERNAYWAFNLALGFEFSKTISESVYLYYGPAVAFSFSYSNSEDLFFASNEAFQRYTISNTRQLGPAAFVGLGFQVNKHLSIKIDNLFSMFDTRTVTWFQENSYYYFGESHTVGKVEEARSKSLYIPDQNNFNIWMCYAF